MATRASSVARAHPINGTINASAHKFVRAWLHMKASLRPRQDPCGILQRTGTLRRSCYHANTDACALSKRLLLCCRGVLQDHPKTCPRQILRSDMTKSLCQFRKNDINFLMFKPTGGAKVFYVKI